MNHESGGSESGSTPGAYALSLDEAPFPLHHEEEEADGETDSCDVTRTSSLPTRSDPLYIRNHPQG